MKNIAHNTLSVINTKIILIVVYYIILITKSSCLKNKNQMIYQTLRCI